MQFTFLQCADLCAAVLLLVACKFPTQELANIHIDIDSSEDTIIHFIESGDLTLDAVKKNRHCKTIKNTISLVCIKLHRLTD